MKKSDDGQNPKGDCVSDKQFCVPPVNRLQIMPNTRLYRMASEVFALTALFCCKMWKKNYTPYYIKS
jgi:hypothetical protein